MAQRVRSTSRKYSGGKDNFKARKSRDWGAGSKKSEKMEMWEMRSSVGVGSWVWAMSEAKRV